MKALLALTDSSLETGKDRWHMSLNFWWKRTRIQSMRIRSDTIPLIPCSQFNNEVAAAFILNDFLCVICVCMSITGTNHVIDSMHEKKQEKGQEIIIGLRHYCTLLSRKESGKESLVILMHILFIIFSSTLQSVFLVLFLILLLILKKILIFKFVLTWQVTSSISSSAFLCQILCNGKRGGGGR